MTSTQMAWHQSNSGTQPMFLEMDRKAVFTCSVSESWTFQVVFQLSHENFRLALVRDRRVSHPQVTQLNRLEIRERHRVQNKGTMTIYECWSAVNTNILIKLPGYEDANFMKVGIK